MKKYEDLTITDDFMFCKLLQNNPDISQELVELVTGEKIGGIVVSDRQHPIEITPDGKGVRLDVYLRDDKDKVYNIEMQTTKPLDISRRARYYQSMIDVELIERGVTYRNLNDSYVIFFMLVDPFDRNLPIYTFENMCLEDKTTRMGDGTKKIFVNADGIRDILNPELEALLDYMRGHAPSSELTSRIDERVAQLKRNERWKGEFMTLYEHYQIEREEGRAETILNAVKSIMTNMELSLEDACKALDITVEEYNKIKNMK